MDANDVVKGVAGFLFALLGAAVVWLVRTVTGTRENLLLSELRVKSLEDKMSALEKNQMTKEDTREVVEAALSKHEAACHTRKIEADKLMHLEMRNIVSEVLEKTLPKFVNELRGQIARSNDTTQPIQRPRGLTPLPPGTDYSAD